MMYCKFNNGNVECQVAMCKNCGWNPEVAEKRIREWVIRRRVEKAMAENEEKNDK